MGTNYYVRPPSCEHCGPEGNEKHIGKRSSGWAFALHVYPDEGIGDLADWVGVWSRDGAKIVDEYGEELTPAQMESIVRYDGGGRRARHDIDYTFCIAHGDGPWDLIVAEFS